MAPERRAGEPGSVAGDIYSLGVLLLQLVTADLSMGLDSGWERQITSAALVDSIRRATDTNPIDRHASVGQLLNEIRALDERDRQIEEASRREQEQARWRARRPFVYGLFAALIAGLSASLIFGVRQRETADRLATEQAMVSATNRFLLDDILGQADPRVTGRSGIPVEEVVKQATGKIDERFRDAPAGVRARLHAAMAKVLSNLGELGLSADQGRIALNLSDESNLGAAEIAEIRLALAHDLIYRAQNDQAKAELDRADKFIQGAGNEFADQKIRALWMRAQIDYNLFSREEALRKFKKAWELRYELAAYVTPALVSELGTKYAEMIMLSGAINEAVSIARKHTEWQAEYLGAKDWRTCATQITLTRILAEADKAEEADQMLPSATECVAKALGPESKLMVGALRARAEVDLRMGRYAKAAEDYGKVIPHYEATRGPRSLIVYDMRMQQAATYRVAGDPRVCEKLVQRLLDEWKEFGPPNEPMRQRTTYFLAGCRLDRGGTDGVAQALQELDAKTLFEDDPGCPWEAFLAYEKGRLAAFSGKLKEAAELFDQAATLMKEWKPKAGQFVPKIEEAKRRVI